MQQQQHKPQGYLTPGRKEKSHTSQPEEMRKTPSNEMFLQIRSIPTTNPIKYPSPDTLSNFERLPFTRKPGG